MNLFEFYATLERYHTIMNPTSPEKLDLAISYCAIREGMRVLDVGCGKGWLMRRLAKRFDIQVTALDINPTFAAEARQLIAAEGLRTESKSWKDRRSISARSRPASTW